MAYIAINGTPLPSPKRGVKPVVSTLVDAGRNSKGIVVAQKIGRDQYKIDDLEWPWLSAEQWSSILKLMSGFFFNVTFVDPVKNRLVTIPMYCGDRSAEPYWVDYRGRPTWYRNCKVNLIDTGR